MTNLVQAIKQNQDIKSLIHIVRGQEIMLDNDLAVLYGYEVKNLNRQVKRNLARFPEDFMFRLTKEEAEYYSRCQFGTLNEPMGRGANIKYLPYAFTEQGVYMLATVLHGELAEQQSIAIMRAFKETRHFLANNALLLDKITNLELKQLKTDKDVSKIFSYIARHKEVSQKIFYEGQIYDAYSLLVDLIQKAKKSIALIDSYVSKTTLDILSKKQANVVADIYTLPTSKLSKTDIAKFNAEYPTIKIHHTNKFHDRFMILDDVTGFLVGASLKDAGKKAFAITKIEDEKMVEELLSKLG